MSVPEIIPLTKLQKYENSYLFVNLVSRINPVNSILCKKEVQNEEPEVAPTYDISNKNACYLSALKRLELHKIILNK